MKSLTKTLLTMGMVLIVATGFAACGKKAQPKPPDGATYPRQYPLPEADKPKQP
jgi:hypothetical protein